MIFWGPVVGLWITQVVAFGPVYFDLFRIQNRDLTRFSEKDSGFDPGCHIIGDPANHIRTFSNALLLQHVSDA